MINTPKTKETVLIINKILVLAIFREVKENIV